MDIREPEGLIDLNRFQIPERIFGAAVAEELVVSVGLVAMLGALAEHKIEDLWLQLKGGGATEGPAISPATNVKRCKRILVGIGGPPAGGAVDPLQQYQTRALVVLDDALRIFESRNEAVHKVWSVPYGPNPSGYKTPPPARRGPDKLARSYEARPGQLEHLKRTIVQLVDLVQRLGDLIGSAPSGVGDTFG